MPRANRYFLPGHIWHITHRCHKQEFLLKFSRDRARWIYWLFEAKKRYRLSVLNYIVTSNHIHLLVRDQGLGEISKSMQLIAGRVAQEYNQRKNRKGAFWEDRYHATAVEDNEHFVQCLLYIDLNMVRAGAVKHPAEWPHSGLAEMLQGRERYHVLDHGLLMKLQGVRSHEGLVLARKSWLENSMKEHSDLRQCDPQWSQTLAVGSQAFVSMIKQNLGRSGKSRQIICNDQGFILKEDEMAYRANFDHEIELLRLD
ncbi:MAG: transposase [Thermodesulfobacteriota bacterium]|nr:transposase [Thermodesulfobacteriota bacterium]